MTRIISTAVASPLHKVSQKRAQEFASLHFAGKNNKLDKLLAVFDNAGIESRYFCVPEEWFMSEKSFSDKNRIYIEWATRLGAEAASECLQRAAVAADEVDHIIFISTTGLATPSIDARLINILKMRDDIRRTPVWGLGCMGGVAGLAYARNYIKAFPDSKVLVVAVELCGLTFLFKDRSISNIVATALFGDGAAAVLLSNYGNGPEILDVQSKIWPNSLDVMGWNFMDEGLQVVFSKSIPSIVDRYANESLSGFVSRHSLSLGDIKNYLIHPGGTKVVEAYRNALGLNGTKMQLAEAILREFGNMSSVTVLYILDRFLKTAYSPNGDYGIMTALGPGFSSESLLLRN
ncbi:MAG: type III polyketide synthase [candidate division Zixibacteria bacterium CG_4_9_14_3_um_filter_46_8]|nr:MAG: type III polyketide synthase [candidate division Zixibacteria bacterium CG_4_9_14_3_um_filter_46_8]